MFQQKHLNLDDKLNRPVHEKLLILEKSRFFHTLILTSTKIKYCILCMIKLHYELRDVLKMEQEIVGKDASERFGPDLHKTLIKKVFDDSDEIEISLPCYRLFSRFWNASIFSYSMLMIYSMSADISRSNF